MNFEGTEAPIDTLPQLGLAAGAAGWKAGHQAIQSGALVLDDLDETARNAQLTPYTAEQARAYMREVVDRHELTPAIGVHLFRIYMSAFIRGALDQALDGGALFGNH